MRGRPRCRRLGRTLPHFMRRGSVPRVSNYNETALYRRRTLASLPRLPRGRLSLHVARRAEPRRADPQHDAVEADPRGATRLPGDRMGPAGPDLPGRALRRLQGNADLDAGRPRAPAALCAPALRGAA